MQAYDIIMIVVLAVATIYGFQKGLAWQIASVSSIFLSYFVAYQFRNEVSQLIRAEPPWNLFLAMLFLYLGTSLLIWITFQFVKSFIDRLKLKEFDHQLGGIVGAAKGVLLCVLITLFAITLLGDSYRTSIVNSHSGRYIAILLDRTHSLIPKEIHDILHPYIHQLNGPENPTDHLHLGETGEHTHGEETAEHRTGITRE